MNTSTDVASRARASRGTSSEAIYRMAARVIARRSSGKGVLLDVGCGLGELRGYVKDLVSEYVGVDVVRYEQFPAGARFVEIDLDSSRAPLPDGSAEVVAALETIEHLENPRAFIRELARLAKPGGLIVVTTPNQLSFLSLLTLLVKKQFNAFQEGPGLYPAHLTAVLEIDLLRIARECGFVEIEIDYSGEGRIPLTARHWPKGFAGRWFSDNLVMSART